MAYYDTWRDHLMQQTGDVVMTFSELHALSKLPRSAYVYEWWWANEDPATTTHVQCKSWLSAGYMAEVDLKREVVKFVKMRPQP